jgi:hypothetical protein
MRRRERLRPRRTSHAIDTPSFVCSRCNEVRTEITDPAAARDNKREKSKGGVREKGEYKCGKGVRRVRSFRGRKAEEVLGCVEKA